MWCTNLTLEHTRIFLYLQGDRESAVEKIKNKTFNIYNIYSQEGSMFELEAGQSIPEWLWGL